jgi:hypothetical protein
MPRFVPVNRERYSQKKWLRYTSYAFAAAEVVAPIVAAELVSAAPAMPCAFLRQGERFTLVAVLSGTASGNMFVGQDGRWFGGYVPALLRLHPFRMLPSEGTDKVLLCVDEESKLIVEGDAQGEPFFDQEGNLSPALKAVFEAAMAVERNRKATDLAVAALAQADVIRPWQITIKSGESTHPISGLYRVDEAALNALPDDAFLGLRKASALPLAYTQMLSTRQLGLFERLEMLHSRAPQSPPLAALPETLDGLLENLKDDLRPMR